MNLLEKELKTYEEHRDELKARALGKFVLVKDGDVVEVFESEFDAIARGYGSFGNTPFLVKQVVPVEIPLDFTSNLLVK